jgi:geranylgeranyl pyrophosphate synthase
MHRKRMILDGIEGQQEWAIDRRDATVRLAHACLEDHARSPLQKRLWQTAMREMTEADEWGNGLLTGRLISTIHLPLAVYCAAAGTECSPIELAVACSFIDLGIDLLDDLADDDLRAYWGDTQRSQIQLVGTTLCYSLALTVLSRFVQNPDRKNAIIQSLIDCSIVAAAGQHADLGLAGSEAPPPEEVMLSVARKNGDTRALFAVLAALSAGAQPSVVGSYGAMAREYGICLQLLADCYELCEPRLDRDLINGTRTWPIAWWLATAGSDERIARNRLLEQARLDEAARSETRRRLLADGAIARTMLEVHLHGQRAMNALASAAPRQEAAHALLHDMITGPLQLMARG